ncbi:ankyrin repeat domain-containing protein, chloroplastic-like [Coffea arabica]|uniref:Ankyrin repeat domain-containing protein, chloroplastic-like n=1 Tax=Coffea arabica TaxID=13443 RepID=A0ABM4W749_COFAR
MSPSATFLLPPSPTSPTSPALFFPAPSKIYRTQQNFPQIPSIFKRACTLSTNSLQFSNGNVAGVEEDDELVIGDCVVFEEGIFDDPFLQDENFNSKENPRGKGKNSKEIEPENLVPEEWGDMQRQINISKKERRKIAQEVEFGRKVEKKRAGLRPIEGGNVGNVNVEKFMKYRDKKLKQLNPIVLDKPEFLRSERVEKGDDEVRGSGQGNSVVRESSSRVAPRNPRMAVYGVGLEDISEFFRSGNYDPDAAKRSEGPRKLFTKDEKVLLNGRVPDLAVASSVKWQPLHTLAASGEFHLVNTLLKHNVDINAMDKDGLIAIHKAILGKKQAIFNYLLRESANPFVRDREGATLMHYAVRTASSQMIKILLLYNVDINLQDNDGWTPLHLAVQSRRTDVVRLLLIKGADKTLRNKDGLTPLDLCLYSGRDTRTYELIKLLKQLPRSPSG